MRLVENTPYRDFRLAATKAKSGEGVSERHNLAILSRFPIEAVEEIRHAFVDPPLYRRRAGEPADEAPVEIGFDRPILYTRLVLGDGRALHVFNLHLRAPRAAPVPGGKRAGAWRNVSAWAEGYFVASVKRAAQALELRRAVERVFDAEGQALVAACGDFNSDERETALRIAVASEGDTRTGRLAPRVLTPVERSLPEDRRYSVIHNGRPEMLDHILASRALMGALRSVEVHNETLLDEAVTLDDADAPPGSFHAPLVAEFAIEA
jgi:endonuclease/exonuclease/phosphatase family metal-dependent hydrolase